MKLMYWLRSIHSWLGLFALPWVIAIGLTGFYLNHSKLVLGYLEHSEMNESTLPAAPLSLPVDQAYALRKANDLHPDQHATADDVTEELYHDRPALFVGLEDREIIIDQASGYVFDKSDYSRVAYSPDGLVADRKFYWGKLFKEFHVRGWIGNQFGTWLADFASLAMVVFGMSGIYLFVFPRVRRFMLRRS